MKDMISWLSEEESGQGLVEYALILALIAIVVIVVLGLIGKSANNKFTQVKDNLA